MRRQLAACRSVTSDTGTGRSSVTSDTGAGRSSVTSDTGAGRSSVTSDTGAACRSVTSDTGAGRSSVTSDTGAACRSVTSDTGDGRSSVTSDTGAGRMWCTKVELLLAVLLAILGSACGGNYTSEKWSTLYDQIMTGYDKRLPPRFNKPIDEQQVEVTVNLYIISMFSISEANMDYSMSIFLRERWVDERLAYDNVLNLTRFELDPSSFDALWVPDMFIPNEKSSDFHEVTVPNKMLHIYPDGTIQYSMRVTGTFFCQMHLQKYPFDTQTCHFEVESYGHDTKRISFVWSENPVTIGKGIQFPQFSLMESSSYKCTKEYYNIFYPCIGIKFVLSRNYGYYLIQIYVPSILIVILSWVNFWLDVTSTPARISLGLLTVLTMTTQSSGARANLPRVSYVKAIDVWMAACLTFVFLGLLEFAYVNVKSRVTTRKKDQNGLYRRESTTTFSGESNGRISTSHTEISVDDKESMSCCLLSLDQARATDKISRVAFPVTFIIFNIVYWFFYMYWEPEKDV